MENIKCEGCGGSLVYNPDKGGLHCENCGNIQIVQGTVFAKTKFLSAASAPTRQIDAELNSKCEGCGANLNTGDVIDSKCPYCGSHQIKSVTEGLDFVPDSIIPFSVSKRKAEQLFRLWIKKRKFAPNDLKKKLVIDNMKGMYFPCWLYDYKTFTTYTGIGVNEHRDSDGDVHVSRTRLSGTRNGTFQNQIEPASNILEGVSIEEFRDYTYIEQNNFDSKYVLGFTMANPTNNVVACFEREKGQRAVEIEDKIKDSLGYDRYENFVTSTEFQEVKWSYTMLPIWISDYEYKKKKYRILVNGRTGSIVGKAPKSGWKIFFTTLGSILIVGAIGLLIYWLENGGF